MSRLYRSSGDTFVPCPLTPVLDDGAGSVSDEHLGALSNEPLLPDLLPCQGNFPALLGSSGGQLDASLHDELVEEPEQRGVGMTNY